MAHAAASTAWRSMTGQSAARAAVTAKGSSPSSRTAAQAAPLTHPWPAAVAASSGGRPAAAATAPSATGHMGAPSEASRQRIEPGTGQMRRGHPQEAPALGPAGGAQRS